MSAEKLAYDDAGNRSTQTLTVTGQPAEVTTYHWDAENRLEGVTTPTAVEHEYGYDYRMRRISRLEDSVGSAVVYSGGLSVAEYEGAGVTPTVEYLRGPDMGGGVGGMLYSLRSGGTEAKYSLSNGRGDVVAQSNGTGSLTWTASYEAYGKRPVETGINADRQRANTKEEDPTGLLNEGFRYRDLETGVWLSRDPAGFVDGPNLYAYVRQNPWSKFDPHGLAEDRIDPDGFKWSDRDQHIVPRQVARDSGWNKEAKTVFDKAKISTEGVGHNNTAHPKYNNEVGAEMAEFLEKKGISDLGSAKNQKELAEEFVEHIIKSDNAYIRGFNEAVTGGPGTVKSWYNKTGQYLGLKSTGRMANKGGKLVTGVGSIVGKGGSVISKGIPIVGGVLIAGIGLANGQSISEAAAEGAIGLSIAGSLAVDVTHLRDMSSLQDTSIQFNNDPNKFLPENTGLKATDAIGGHMNTLKRLLEDN